MLSKSFSDFKRRWRASGRCEINDSKGNPISRGRRAYGKGRRYFRNSSRAFEPEAMIDVKTSRRSDLRLICASTGTSKSLILGRRFADESSDREDEFFIYCEATDPLLVLGEGRVQSESARPPAAADNEVRKKFGRVSRGKKMSRGSRFRASLFPNVPPYVSFHSEDCAVGPASSSSSSCPETMRWKRSSWTPRLVLRVAENSGFRLSSRGWSGAWERDFPEEPDGLAFFQKVNHFPGTASSLGRKDELSANLNAMARKFGKSEFGFAPESFVLPRDGRALSAAWNSPEPGRKWILKPPMSARGLGLRVVDQRWEIPPDVYLVVQRYLARPMLIRGAKFDLRLYVLVTGFDPLRIYLYADGLVRIATSPYDPDARHHRDRFMHLTNTSVNKCNAAYSPTGHLWPLATLWALLERDSVDVPRLWAGMKDIVVKTLVAVEGRVAPLVRKSLPSRYACFELFGFDILIEEDLRPWLLEVNTAPSLRVDSTTHRRVKAPLVRSLLNVAGFQTTPEALPWIRLMERNRLAHRATRKQFNHSYRSRIPGESPDSVIRDLTPDDVRLLVTFEDELTQLELFEKIFPTPQSHRYRRFFSMPGYYDVLLDAWERAQGPSREPGIRRLRNLCAKNYHLIP